MPLVLELAQLAPRQFLGMVLSALGLILLLIGIAMHRRRVDRDASLPPSVQTAGEGTHPSEGKP